MDSGSSVFRTKQETTSTTEPNVVAKKSDGQSVIGTDQVEVPFLDYNNTHGHSLAVDMFGLGDNYDVFNQEIGLIDVYFRGKVHEGIVANDVDTIRNEIKKMEKMLDIKNETRTAVKLGILAAHIKFLIDTDNVKMNMRKYNN